MGLCTHERLGRLIHAIVSVAVSAGVIQSDRQDGKGQKQKQKYGKERAAKTPPPPQTEQKGLNRPTTDLKIPRLAGPSTRWEPPMI